MFLCGFDFLLSKANDKREKVAMIKDTQDIRLKNPLNIDKIVLNINDQQLKKNITVFAGRMC